MIGIHNAFKPVLIQEYNDKFELLVVEAKVGNKELRIISGYGPQKNWPIEDRTPFFEALEEELIKAELAGKTVFIEIDANSKLGCQIIPKDKHKQTPNGRLLAGVINRQRLIVGNSLENKCSGSITRKRITSTSLI